jgi:hypothetical protein
MRMNNRKHLIRLRLSDSEYGLFLHKVEESGLSQSAFMRRLINGATLVQRPCEHHGELLSRLSDISNGMGEILRRAQASDTVTDQDTAMLRQLITDTWGVVSERY